MVIIVKLLIVSGHIILVLAVISVIIGILHEVIICLERHLRIIIKGNFKVFISLGRAPSLFRLG